MLMKKMRRLKTDKMLKVNFSNRQRKTALPDNTESLVVSAINAALSVENFPDNSEVNVTFVSDDKIKKINYEFRNINSSTDVLSFPLGYDGVYDINPENNCFMLGDVIISIDHAIMQAELFGHGLDREIAYLTVHSVFHLLGYDHIDEGEQKSIMRKKEEEALKLINLNIK